MNKYESLPKMKELKIESGNQIILIASTGGSKSTLVASLVVNAASLIAIDSKGELEFPNTLVVDLPSIDDKDFIRVLDRAIFENARVIIRPHILDLETIDVYDQIFFRIYARENVVVWIDEIGAIAKTSTVFPKWLAGCSNRGRTRGITLFSCSQAPYGQLPMCLRRNSTYSIFGVLMPSDVENLPYPDIDATLDIPIKSGKFVIYQTGIQGAKSLYVPIPKELKEWRAP
jgi:hypothetical protein